MTLTYHSCPVAAALVHCPSTYAVKIGDVGPPPSSTTAIHFICSSALFALNSLPDMRASSSTQQFQGLLFWHSRWNSVPQQLQQLDTRFKALLKTFLFRWRGWRRIVTSRQKCHTQIRLLTYLHINIYHAILNNFCIYWHSKIREHWSKHRCRAVSQNDFMVTEAIRIAWSVWHTRQLFTF